MFGKILSDTVARVRAGADEVRQTAQRAVTEVLGLPTRPMSARELEELLEREAMSVHSLEGVADMYARWGHEVLESSRGVTVYLDTDLDIDRDLMNVVTPKASAEPLEPSEEQSGKPDESGTSASVVGPSNPKPPSSCTAEEDEFKSPQDGTSSTATSRSPLSATQASSARDAQTTTSARGKQPVRLSVGDDNPSSSIAVEDDPYRPAQLTFKQVFLRSKALEYSLGAMSRVAEVREALAGPVEEGETGTARAALHQLLPLCLRGDSKLHTELVFLFCTSQEASDEKHRAFLSHLVSILKEDWRDDYLFETRRHLATQIERMKFEISHTAKPPHLEHLTGNLDVNTVMASAEKHNTRVSASRSLIHLYEETETNLRRSAVLREERCRNTFSRLDVIRQKLSVSEEDCDAAQTGATDRSVELQEQLVKVGEDVVVEMKSVEKVRIELDEKIATLTDEREEVIKKFNELSKQISVLEEERKSSLDNTAALKQKLEGVRRRFKSKMATEEGLKRHSESRKLDLQNIRTVAIQSERQLGPLLRALSDDVASKSRKIGKPTSVLIINHLTYESEKLQNFRVVLQTLINHLNTLRPELQKATEAAANAAATSDALRGADDLGKSGSVLKAQNARKRSLRNKVLDARHKLAKHISLLDDCWSEIQAFGGEKVKALIAAGRDEASEGGGDEDFTNGSEEDPAAASAKRRGQQVENVAKAKELLAEMEICYRDIKANIVTPNLALLTYPFEFGGTSSPSSEGDHQVSESVAEGRVFEEVVPDLVTATVRNRHPVADGALAPHKETTTSKESTTATTSSRAQAMKGSAVSTAEAQRSAEGPSQQDMSPQQEQHEKSLATSTSSVKAKAVPQTTPATSVDALAETSALKDEKKNESGRSTPGGAGSPTSQSKRGPSNPVPGVAARLTAEATEAEES